MATTRSRSGARHESRAGARGLAWRLAWITGLRLVFFTLLLGATAVFYLGGELSRYPSSLRVVFVTIGVRVRARRGLRGRPPHGASTSSRLAYAQIVLDQVTWTAIVYVTGGATSGATSFYAFTCLVGAMLIGLRGALTAAAAGGALVRCSCASPSASTGSRRRPTRPAFYVTSWAELIYPLLVNALGILVVALLGGVPRRAPAPHGRRARGGERARARGRAARGARAHRGGARARDPQPARVDLAARSRCCASRRRSPTEDKQLCAIIRREAIRLNDLVTDMLDLSKPRRPEVEDDRRGRARPRRRGAGGAERAERERRRAGGLRRAERTCTSRGATARRCGR